MNKIILDVDGVIIDSILAVTKYYETVECVARGTYNQRDVKVWNFHDVIPHATNESIETIFDSQFFWVNVELIDGVREFIDKYREHIILCSIGSVKNQIHKINWLTNVLGDLDFLPVITNMSEHPKRINKHFIDMKDCIYIEDSAKHLDDSNASVKILFNNYGNFDAEWAKSDIDYMKCTAWSEVDKIVEKYFQK